MHISAVIVKNFWEFQKILFQFRFREKNLEASRKIESLANRNSPESLPRQDTHHHHKKQQTVRVQFHYPNHLVLLLKYYHSTLRPAGRRSIIQLYVLAPCLIFTFRFFFSGGLPSIQLNFPTKNSFLSLAATSCFEI